MSLEHLDKIKKSMPEPAETPGASEKWHLGRMVAVVVVCLVVLLGIWAIELTFTLPKWFGLVAVLGFVVVTAPFLRRVRDWVLG